jgi:ATP phosphoribosyltransferase regulatory subunit HisZ
MAFRKTSKRLCAMRKKTIFNIILDPLRINGEKLWSVSHLEPYDCCQKKEGEVSMLRMDQGGT